MSSLKVCPHPRGHVASCNGSVGELETRVDCALHDPCLSASDRAALVQEWTEKERMRKALKLSQFQKDVKNRVSAREKLVQQEMAAATTKAMKSEQEAAERALKLDNTKVRHSVAMSHDVDDVKMTASGRDSHFSQYQTRANSSPLQTARTALLFESQNRRKSPNAKKEVTSIATNSLAPCQKVHSNYHSVAQLSPEICSRRLSMERVASPCGRARCNPDPQQDARKFTAPGQVEHMDRIQAGKQYLVFRRLYSELEREQVRKKKMQDTHSRHVKAIKKKKEANRRKVEEANSTESCSIISTSISEEKQMAVEWAELMLLEERKQELQKAKETERYMAALRVRLKELVAVKKLEIPPLCSCGETVWDTNPKTCANNCIFYRNPKVYVKDISNLIQSLNL